MKMTPIEQLIRSLRNEKTTFLSEAREAYIEASKKEAFALLIDVWIDKLEQAYKEEREGKE